MGELELPSPRRPRTKVPSVEIIIRTPDGNSISYIAPFKQIGGEAIEILRAVLVTTRGGKGGA